MPIVQYCTNVQFGTHMQQRRSTSTGVGARGARVGTPPTLAVALIIMDGWDGISWFCAWQAPESTVESNALLPTRQRAGRTRLPLRHLRAIFTAGG